MDLILFRKVSYFSELEIRPLLMEYREYLIDREELRFLYDILVVEEFVFTDIGNNLERLETIDLFLCERNEDSIS